MTDETESMLKTLIWTIGMIAQSQQKDRERIALAYQEAQELVAGVPKDHGDAPAAHRSLLQALRRL